MRIALHDGTTLHWLAGQPWIDERVISSAADFRKSGTREQEVVPLIGATHPALLDKYNLLNRLAWRCYRQLGTLLLADAWVMGYEDTFASTGTLRIYSQSNGVWIRRDMANAIIQPPAMAKQGTTVIVDYEAAGRNIFAATAPVRASRIADATGTNNNILFTARDFGTLGNELRIRYVISGTGAAVLSVVESWPDVTITAGSATTAQAVIDAVNAGALNVRAAASGTVTGVIAAYGPTNLAGGTE